MSNNSSEAKKRFIEIIRENEGLIYKVAKMYSNSLEDEQDLRQDIVYQLWKSFPSFRGESMISTWMYRIALNTAIRYLDQGKKKANQVEMDEAFLNRPDVVDNSNEDRHQALFAQIKKLSDIEKAIIFLFLEGKSYEEIAAVTGFTVTNVGTRLGRIKQKLMVQIEKAGYGF
ncbi:RNA polymerase sigma factor [Desertivirga brevis]|uniref:RNA polymerase sigma factor n=1 Tax=Desertivirga brevis TaxID=2810310 RepID=UPI001A964637|nr:sigma-70 family RNA polymerase sigma factor [Pedobacter sp. SYSU D00873]